MKIAQIVTYISADAAFGGPVSVAVAQAVQLAECGHDVELLAGWDGVAEIDAPGVRVRLFHTHSLLPAGFSGLVAPGLLSHIRANHGSYDVVHIHLARDLITLPVALFLSLRGANFVVQPHGMVVPDARLRARVFDFLGVRPVLRRASSVIAYKGVDDEALSALSRGEASIEFLVNGVESGGLHDGESRTSDVVMFMARLHPRKRVMAFAEMARILSGRRVPCRFVVVGPDEGDLRELQSFIQAHMLEEVFEYEGPIPYSEVRRRLRRSGVFVLPSVNEPFPVTVLEAMAIGTPCVITDSCGLAPYFREDLAGLVTDGTPTGMADAVERLIREPDARDSIIRNAEQSIQDRFSIRAVVNILVGLYRKGIANV
ncbi:glycosyltransferase [Cryobacterium sp. TMT2-14]|uniref:glycosyltransferase n=1 Tax=Cryobacterium sp. TMT2-14 TaxID=1259245 RepID=UPI00106BA59E|nr:glycosyltransferase [Cryobacterium sp. TMT2-14]TFC33840.1 glycosyltransferase [Cryobacterium sp. TMT2-14]